MKWFHKFFNNASGKALLKVATFMLVLGSSAVSLCAVPFWHNEPVMPQNMLDEIM